MANALSIKVGNMVPARCEYYLDGASRTKLRFQAPVG